LAVAAAADRDPTTHYKTAAMDDFGKSCHNIFRMYAASAALLVAHSVIRAFVQVALKYRYEYPRGNFQVGFPRSFTSSAAVMSTGPDFTFKAAGEEVFFNMDPWLLPSYTINLLDKRALSGLLIGAVTPFLVAGLCLDGILRGSPASHEETSPEATEHENVIRKMVRGQTLRTFLTAALLIGIIMLIGFAGGPYLLASYLFALILTGFLISTAFAHAGSTWDSARRYVASGSAQSHEPKSVAESISPTSTAVTGLIGYSLKDSSSGVINATIKFLPLLALIFAPAFLEACKDLPIWESHCFSNRPSAYLPRPTGPVRIR
jgi:hypothetical protein